MKSKEIIIFALVTIGILSSCAKVPKLQVPSVKPTPKYELGGLYLTTDAKQMSGVARDSIKLGVGESAVIYARGMSTIETGGKWFELPSDVVVNWKADRELEVTPTVGHVVTVKVVRPISGAAYLTATTTDKSGKKIESILAVTMK
ncbi:MAG: hypothetical protein ACK4WJ_02580 [Endomicrobiia bacterium]